LVVARWQVQCPTLFLGELPEQGGLRLRVGRGAARIRLDLAEQPVPRHEILDVHDLVPGGAAVDLPQRGQEIREPGRGRVAAQVRGKDLVQVLRGQAKPLGREVDGRRG